MSEMSKKLQAKNIAPLVQSIASLPSLECQVSLEDTINITFNSSLRSLVQNQILDLALRLKPWRKGPFCIDELYIDSEWQSFKKYNLIAPHLNLQDKDVADIGCNNGYYLFRMLELSPKSLVGFDPYALFKCQFDFLNHFIKSEIKYRLHGVEDLIDFPQNFDVVLCMGVLYHRTDPIHTLKNLAKALRPNGELILDTLILDSNEEIALCPQKSYAKMSNAFFIPSIKALQGWCERAGFVEFECFAQVSTDTNEQRKTRWIDSLSLENFLDPNDSQRTIEGYQAPLRGYFRLRRK